MEKEEEQMEQIEQIRLSRSDEQKKKAKKKIFLILKISLCRQKIARAIFSARARVKKSEKMTETAMKIFLIGSVCSRSSQ